MTPPHVFPVLADDKRAEDDTGDEHQRHERILPVLLEVIAQGTNHPPEREQTQRHQQTDEAVGCPGIAAIGERAGLTGRLIDALVAPDEHLGHDQHDHNGGGEPQDARFHAHPDSSDGTPRGVQVGTDSGGRGHRDLLFLFWLLSPNGDCYRQDICQQQSPFSGLKPCTRNSHVTKNCRKFRRLVYVSDRVV